MKLKRAKRALAALGVVVAGGAVVPLAAAAPASATPIRCTAYLAEKHYKIGPRVDRACDNGFSDNFVLRSSCKPLLMMIKVKPREASEACRRAGL